MLEAIQAHIKSIESVVENRSSAILVRAEQLYYLKKLEELYSKGAKNGSNNAKRPQAKHTGSK